MVPADVIICYCASRCSQSTRSMFDLSKFFAIHYGLQTLNSRMESRIYHNLSEKSTDNQYFLDLPIMKCFQHNQPLLFRKLKNFSGLASRICCRLLKQDMLASLQRFHRPLIMQAIRQQVIYDIHLWIIYELLISIRAAIDLLESVLLGRGLGTAEVSSSCSVKYDIRQST
jgi:hypothetical protein